MRAAAISLLCLMAFASMANATIICGKPVAAPEQPVAVAMVDAYEVRHFDHVTRPQNRGKPSPLAGKILGGCSTDFVPERVVMFEIAYSERKTFVVSDWKARQILDRFCGALGKRAVIPATGTAQSAGKRLSVHRIAGTCA